MTRINNQARKEKYMQDMNDKERNTGTTDDTANRSDESTGGSAEDQTGENE